MRAAFMKHLNDILIRELPSAPLAPDEIRIRIDACGVCGTDVTAAKNRDEKIYKAFGHEVAGTVLERGGAVTDLRIGQRVVLESSSACGRCENCRNARPRFCSNPRSFWPKPPYGFADEMVAPATCAVPYEGLPPDQACLAESLGVALDMFDVAEIGLGHHVLVMGLGPIGLMALRLARLAGAASITACDVSRAKKRLELAQAFGADAVVAVDQTPLAEVRFAEAPDRILVTAPPRTLPEVLRVTASGAIISMIGIEYGEGGNIVLDANFLHFNRVQLRGSFAAPGLCLPRAIDLLRCGRIDGDALITHRFNLDEIGTAMRVATEGLDVAAKVVVIP